MIPGPGGITVDGMTVKQYMDLLIEEIEAYGREEATEERAGADRTGALEQGSQEAEGQADTSEAFQPPKR